jgi:hypothetical protein
MFGGKCEVEGVGVLVLIPHDERMWGEAGLRHKFVTSSLNGSELHASAALPPSYRSLHQLDRRLDEA